KIRSEKGLTFGDALFNMRKLAFLQKVLIRYRRLVQFGDHVMMDSASPPFPSPAFDRRIANYLNNLDMMEMPSGIVSISVTNSCPYSCQFCSTSALSNSPDDLDEELLKRVIRQIEDIGVSMIILHGGEPMFRYDRFLRLVKHVNNDTCLWTFTNGFGATRERARELKENGLFGVWISLDHYDPDVHNRMRGTPKAFDNVRRAVECFQEAGVYTCLSLMPHDDLQEAEHFKKYYDLARDLGVAEIRVMEKKPVGREACRGVTQHSSALEALHKAFYKDPAYADHPPLSGLSTWLEKDAAYGCQCRFEYLYISPKGEVQPCEATRISFGNIQQDDFLHIYKRACQAFPIPSTGCIPMVMYPEVLGFEEEKDRFSSREKATRSTKIMEGFRAKGKIPGVYQPIWETYERRLRSYKRRQARLAQTDQEASGDSELLARPFTPSQSQQGR
ncbi:MAG: radical SAM protein, partial [Deltaproteobacteria bacterium]